MSKNLTGKKMPKFKANATSEKEISNADFENKNLVIYFYPKDSTPGCTTEGQDFRDNYKKFQKLNTEIWNEEDTLLWVKAAFDKTGYWEYRLKTVK